MRKRDLIKCDLLRHKRVDKPPNTKVPVEIVLETASHYPLLIYPSKLIQILGFNLRICLPHSRHYSFNVTLSSFLKRLAIEIS